jgi:hypothetical protein
MASILSIRALCAARYFATNSGSYFDDAGGSAKPLAGEMD